MQLEHVGPVHPGLQTQLDPTQVPPAALHAGMHTASAARGLNTNTAAVHLPSFIICSRGQSRAERAVCIVSGEFRSSSLFESGRLPQPPPQLELQL